MNTKMSLGSQTEGSGNTSDDSRCSSWGTDKEQQVCFASYKLQLTFVTIEVATSGLDVEQQ